MKRSFSLSFNDMWCCSYIPLQYTLGIVTIQLGVEGRGFTCHFLSESIFICPSKINKVHFATEVRICSTFWSGAFGPVSPSTRRPAQGRTLWMFNDWLINAWRRKKSKYSQKHLASKPYIWLTMTIFHSLSCNSCPGTKTMPVDEVWWFHCEQSQCPSQLMWFPAM